MTTLRSRPRQQVAHRRVEFAATRRKNQSNRAIGETGDTNSLDGESSENNLPFAAILAVQSIGSRLAVFTIYNEHSVHWDSSHLSGYSRLSDDSD